LTACRRTIARLCSRAYFSQCRSYFFKNLLVSMGKKFLNKSFFRFFSVNREKNSNDFFFAFLHLNQKSFEVLKLFSYFFMSIEFLCSKQWQSNVSGAWSTRLLNKGDWLTICSYMNIYQLMNINITSNNFSRNTF